MSDRFEMRLSDELAARIDEARGMSPRATWIKLAIERELDREKVPAKAEPQKRVTADPAPQRRVPRILPGTPEWDEGLR